MPLARRNLTSNSGVNKIIALLALICEKLDIPCEKITAAFEHIEKMEESNLPHEHEDTNGLEGRA